MCNICSQPTVWQRLPAPCSLWGGSHQAGPCLSPVAGRWIGACRGEAAWISLCIYTCCNKSTIEQWKKLHRMYPIGCIAVWYGNCFAKAANKLQRVVNAAQLITQTSLPSLNSIYISHCHLNEGPHTPWSFSFPPSAVCRRYSTKVQKHVAADSRTVSSLLWSDS